MTTSLYAYNKGTADIITIDLDAAVHATPETMIEAVANSIECDFVDMLNEGAPVNYGNACAAYEFAAIGHESRKVYRYAVYTSDAEKLEDFGTIDLAPLEEVEPPADVEGMTMEAACLLADAAEESDEAERKAKETLYVSTVEDIARRAESYDLQDIHDAAEDFAREYGRRCALKYYAIEDSAIIEL